MDRYLTVKTPAASSRLATLAQARADRALAELDDAALGRLLDLASCDIAAYLNRGADAAQVYAIGRETLVETLTGCFGERELHLGRYPVASLVAVTLDGVSSTLSQYRVQHNTGILRQAAAGYTQAFLAWEVVVEYTAGWLLPGEQGANLPLDIQDACILLARYKQQSDLQAEIDADLGGLRRVSIPGAVDVELGDAFRGINGARTSSGFLPEEVRSRLERYRQIVLV